MGCAPRIVTAPKGGAGWCGPLLCKQWQERPDGDLRLRLGLAAGLEMSINARRLTVLTIGFRTDMVIPWGIIGVGAGVVMLIAVVGSILPAAHVARTEPLSLLQAGRASA